MDMRSGRGGHRRRGGRGGGGGHSGDFGGGEVGGNLRDNGDGWTLIIWTLLRVVMMDRLKIVVVVAVVVVVVLAATCVVGGGGGGGVGGGGGCGGGGVLLVVVVVAVVVVVLLAATCVVGGGGGGVVVVGGGGCGAGGDVVGGNMLKDYGLELMIPTNWRKFHMAVVDNWGMRTTPILAEAIESRSFENSYIPENPRTPKPPTSMKGTKTKLLQRPTSMKAVPLEIKAKNGEVFSSRSDITSQPRRNTDFLRCQLNRSIKSAICILLIVSGLQVLHADLHSGKIVLQAQLSHFHDQLDISYEKIIKQEANL
ncbi:hypothetical protein LXL04_011753 [Taraxacum kok-saghyz]